MMTGGSQHCNEQPGASADGESVHTAEGAMRAKRDGFARAGLTARAASALRAGAVPLRRSPANDDLPARPPQTPGFRAEAVLVMTIVALGYVNAAAQLFA